MEKLSDTSGHIILYAKNFYKKKDPFSDLKQIVEKFSGVEPRSISHGDVLYWLAKTNNKVHDAEYILSKWWSFVEDQISPFTIESHQQDLVKQLIGELKSRDYSTFRIIAKYNADALIRFYLSLLAKSDVKGRFDLGGPDKEVLPLVD